MIDKLYAIYERWQDVGKQLGDPNLMDDMKRYIKLNKEFKDLQIIVDAYKEYKDLLSNIDFNKQLLNDKETDPELREMAKVELEICETKLPIVEENIRQILVPVDPEDDKNTQLEIRAGTGGDEAGIFVGDLYRMYTRFCELKGWTIEILNLNESESGGYKEVVLKINGEGVYGVLKYESGVHRVQRVPETEAKGRVHTSAASVVALPEADEVDVQINPTDLRIDTFRASGAGGQHVNRTESAVRITHIPSGVVAECQDERSQLQNRERAMQVIRTKVYDMEYKKHLDAIAAKRKTLVSTGDRSAKIRTYNYPQSRVTDHRINLTIFNLPDFMNGNIMEMIDSLQVAEHAEKLKAGLEL